MQYTSNCSTFPELIPEKRKLGGVFVDNKKLYPKIDLYAYIIFKLNEIWF